MSTQDILTQEGSHIYIQNKSQDIGLAEKGCFIIQALQYFL